MNETAILWPPTYQIKKHRRAKYVKLRASKETGLQITVPYRFSLKELPAILEKHREWITKQLLALSASQAAPLPTELVLLDRIWRVRYEFCDKKMEILCLPSQELVVIGRIHNKNLCKANLIAWLKNYAKTQLSTMFKAVSERIQLCYDTLIFRDQKTRWGSCTAKTNISLNYKLIFLPTYLIQHVMVHELCHTKHLNHSAKFWNLVGKYDPEWQKHRKALNKANQFIPLWL